MKGKYWLKVEHPKTQSGDNLAVCRAWMWWKQSASLSHDAFQCVCVLSVSVVPYPQRAKVCLLLSLFYDNKDITLLMKGNLTITLRKIASTYSYNRHTRQIVTPAYNHANPFHTHLRYHYFASWVHILPIFIFLPRIKKSKGQLYIPAMSFIDSCPCFA